MQHYHNPRSYRTELYQDKRRQHADRDAYHASIYDKKHGHQNYNKPYERKSACHRSSLNVHRAADNLSEYLRSYHAVPK